MKLKARIIDRIEYGIAVFVYGKKFVQPYEPKEERMADVVIEIDALGVMQVNAQTEEGAVFLDSCTIENMQVIDSGRIALPVGNRDDLINSANTFGVTVDG